MAQTREQMSTAARVILILKWASCRDRRHETLAQKMATTMARPATDVKEPVSKKYISRGILRKVEEELIRLRNCRQNAGAANCQLCLPLLPASGPSPPFEV